MIIKAEKTFGSREELDAYIRTTFGDNPEANKDIILEMPQEELTKLSLSDKVNVFGVKVKKQQ